MRRSRQLDIFNSPHVIATIRHEGVTLRCCEVCGQWATFGGMTVTCPGKEESGVRVRLSSGENYFDGEWREINDKRLKRYQKPARKYPRNVRHRSKGKPNG